MSAISIRKLVPDDRLSQIRSTVAKGPYVAGAQTAVGGAALLKHNLQLDPRSPAAAQAAELMVGACRDNASFMAATWIEAMLAPLFCRYEPGMTYGNHIDAAFMGEPPDQLRCDIAVTVCLNDGSSYDGGELVIDATGVPRAWKGEAGDCLIYPADTLHRVEPVTRGTREVAVLWIQSLVRDAAQRRILFDVKESLDELDRIAPAPPAVETLRRTYFNLIRMWA